MNTLTITIEATPDNLKKLAEAFDSGIDCTIGADDIPAVRRTRNDAKKEIVVAPEIVPEAPKDPTVPEPAAKPEPERAVTKAEIRQKALQLTKAGKEPEIAKVFEEFGAKKLGEIRKEDYPRCLERLEAIA